MPEESWWWDLVKYFFHGISFSVILLFLGFLWVFVLAALVVVGLFIGFIIGLLVLFFFIGGLNSVLTALIWDLDITVEWKSVLLHGFVLFIVLLIVDIPGLILNIAVPSLATTISLFVIYCFIDGLISKKIAQNWEE